jgi:hypothetical protein
MRSFLAIVLFFAIACGGRDSTGPDPDVRFSGNWTAPTAGQFFDDIRVTIFFASPSDGAMGSWQIHSTGCTSGTQCDFSGFFVDGTLNDGHIVIPFERPDGCAPTVGVVSATLTAANTLSGTFVRSVCVGPNDSPAAITLTRQ